MEMKSALHKIEVELTITETMMMAEILRIVSRPNFYKAHFTKRMNAFEKEFVSGLKKINSEFIGLGYLREDVGTDTITEE